LISFVEVSCRPSHARVPRVCAANRPGLALVDIELGQDDGIELASRLPVPS
jgi:hypothetical protein